MIEEVTLYFKHISSRRSIKVRVREKEFSLVTNMNLAHAGGEVGKEECRGRWRVIRLNENENERRSAGEGWWLECVTCGVYASPISECKCKTVYCRCGRGEDRGRGTHAKAYSIDYK